MGDVRREDFFIGWHALLGVLNWSEMGDNMGYKTAKGERRRYQTLEGWILLVTSSIPSIYKVVQIPSTKRVMVIVSFKNKIHF
jgi:hypothetical protein